MARFDYTTLGLVKKDDVVTFNGNGIMDLDQKIRDGLSNYGLFVKMTRALAGHEKDSEVEKKAILTSMWDLLKSGKMTSGKKTGLSAEAILDRATKDVKLTPAESRLMASIKAKVAAANAKKTN